MSSAAGTEVSYSMAMVYLNEADSRPHICSAATYTRSLERSQSQQKRAGVYGSRQVRIASLLQERKRLSRRTSMYEQLAGPSASSWGLQSV
jgi:hypothetical protein